MRSMTPMSALGLGLVAVFLSGGCREASEADLPGRYLAKTSWGESSLDLRGDHTFVQDARPRNGRPKSLSGRWTFRDSFLSIKPCIMLDRGSGGIVADLCGGGVEVTGLNHVEISLDPDAGLAYEKLKATTGR
jgi:hypothetical protein